MEELAYGSLIVLTAFTIMMAFIGFNPRLALKRIEICDTWCFEVDSEETAKAELHKLGFEPYYDGIYRPIKNDKVLLRHYGYTCDLVQGYSYFITKYVFNGYNQRLASKKFFSYLDRHSNTERQVSSNVSFNRARGYTTSIKIHYKDGGSLVAHGFFKYRDISFMQYLYFRFKCKRKDEYIVSLFDHRDYNEKNSEYL